MDWENRGLRFGALFLGLAVILRLFSASPLAAQVQALSAEDLVSMFLFLEAGRVVKLEEQEQEPTAPTEEAASAAVIHTPQLPLTFSGDDLALLEVNNLTGYHISADTLLQETLGWNLTQEGPAVLILHTHATESYQNTTGYEESASFRTLDTDYNVVSIGAELARILDAGGIRVIHDTTLHDSPSYNDAYYNSRQAIASYMERYPSIRLVLDIHRDAAEDASGSQVAYTSTLGGETAAQLMLVVGSDAGGLEYPNWRENLALGLHLQAALERRSPGICRPLSLRAQRYNQDLHPGSILVEVGSAGNNHAQAMLAVQALGQGILDIAHGTTWVGKGDG